MPTFERGTVVRVLFSYTNRDVCQNRPALVLSDGVVGDEGILIWVAMITSARNRPWAGDVAISDLAGTGLPMPSVVRTAKVATVEVANAEPRGRVPGKVITAVQKELARPLGLRF